MKNEIRIRKDIISLESVSRACADFSNIVRIQIFEEPEYWICSFGKCTYALDLTEMEFENYVIDLENMK